MPINEWHLSIDLDDLWEDPENPDSPPMDRRAQIAQRIRESTWRLNTSDYTWWDRLLTGLADPDETDPDMFMQALYDLADTDRVWLDTDGVERRRRERVLAGDTER